MRVAAAVAVLLMAAAAIATVQALKATREKDRAEATREEAIQTGKVAEQLRALEAEQRGRAEVAERSVRLNLYAADMNLAQQALEMNNLGRARRLLDRHRPGPGSGDYRGWEWRYLWRQCQSQALAVLTRRPERGFSFSFSPNGKRLAIGYYDGRVELWNVTRRVLEKTLQSEEGEQRAHVAFSTRTEMLVATAGPGILKRHDLANNRESTLWEGPGQWIRDISYSSDGACVTAYIHGEGGSRVLVIDSWNGAVLSSHRATGATDHMGVARLAADHQRFYIGHSDHFGRKLSVQCVNPNTGEEQWRSDGFIALYDAVTAERTQVLHGHMHGIHGVTFSPDGMSLVSARQRGRWLVKVSHAQMLEFAPEPRCQEKSLDGSRGGPGDRGGGGPARSSADRGPGTSRNGKCPEGAG